MATKLDMEFVKGLRKNHQDAVTAQQHARLGFETLVSEVTRLESYVAALEKRLTPEQINEASAEAVKP